MRTIWKYTLAITDAVQNVPMPRNPNIVRFDMQNGVPCVWALVESHNPVETHSFRVFGTGHPIPEDSRYVGTCKDGGYVWHLFAVFT